jgi:hypothetical protein
MNYRSIQLISGRFPVPAENPSKLGKTFGTPRRTLQASKLITGRIG